MELEDISQVKTTACRFLGSVFDDAKMEHVVL
jgi:hypothetical protein